ncbi:MAG: endonuclease/exonuclease/phosphatase family protein [Microcoleaceae cyanobacterium]
MQQPPTFSKIIVFTRRLFILLFLSNFCLIGCASSSSLTVIGFNVESGDADPDFIAKHQIKPLKTGDIWGFSEVQNSTWLQTFEQAMEADNTTDFKSILGTTGKADKLAIVYDSNELEKLDDFELLNINIGGNVRAPLVAHFKLKSNQKEFLFMVNHLYRSRNDARHQQARLLNRWAKKQTLPIIAVGDYNFDWDVVQGEKKHDKGYDLLTENGIFTWIRPELILATHCSQKYNSVLDFVFVSGSAQTWKSSSKILYPESSYCPDNSQKSDHRPVLSVFDLSLN